MRLVPSEYTDSVKTVGKGTEYGVHDTFREGFRSVRSEITNNHPLEGRLSRVRQDNKVERHQRDSQRRHDGTVFWLPLASQI
jgi:hypothetical protein